jgi:hypothetical protein
VIAAKRKKKEEFYSFLTYANGAYNYMALELDDAY